MHAHVLRDERRHRLHQRARDQHGEVDDLARNAVARRRCQAQPVDERAEREERQLRQKLLQGERQTDAQKLSALGIQAKVCARDGERQFLSDEQCDREHHADSLRQNRHDGRARGVHVKARN